MNNPPDFWRRDYPFQIACVQPPPPLRKNRRRSVCGEDATVHRLVSDGWSISSYSVKTANKKIPVSSVFNDSEGLYGTTVCRCHVSKPHYSARLMGFGSRGPSEFAPKCRDRDCVGRRRTGTRHGNVHCSVREKQRNVVYRQRVLQTVTSLLVVSLVFREHDLRKIANIHPQQEGHIFAMEKISSPEMEPRSWLTSKRRFA